MVSRHEDAAASLTPQATRRRRGGRKRAVFFLLCCRCCQAPLHTFFLPSLVLCDCGDTWPRSVWRLPVALRPLVSNDLLSVRVHTPVTRFFLRLSTRTERPVGGDPTSPTASLQGPEKHRAASTSTQADARLGTDRPLTPLCAGPPWGIRRVSGSAKAPQATGAPPPHSRCACGASRRHQNAPCTSHSGHSRADNGAHSRPTRCSSSAQAGSRTW
jgi:hypothetical protein